MLGRINEWKPDYRDSARKCYELAAAMAREVVDRTLLERLVGRLEALDRVVLSA